MFESKMREWMKDLVAPQVEQGVKHKEQFFEHINTLREHQTRIEFIETAMFHGQKKEDRFEFLHRKLAEAEEQRTMDKQELMGMFESHKLEIQE